MPLFYVTVEVIRTVTVDVQADNIDKAKEQACDIVAEADPDIEYDTWYAEAVRVSGQDGEEDEDE